MPAPGDDPEALSKSLEAELALKRLGWKKMRQRRTIWRALSLLFLLIVLIAAVLACLHFVPATRERVSHPTPRVTSPTR